MTEGTHGHIILAGDALPSDAHVEAYTTHEGVSFPYAVDVEMSTRDATFRVDACLQRRALLEVHDAQGGVRHYDGLPDRVGFVAYRDGKLVFRLRLRPALAALEHREGSRIFQDESPIGVVKRILGDAGVDQGVEWRLRQAYEPREFLCQYRETEMDFVHRIFVEEGICYFFWHTQEGHKLIFADHPDAFMPQDGFAPVLLSSRKGAGARARPLLDLRRKKALRPTEVALRDYDFEQPDVYPTAAVPAPGPRPMRHFTYPGGFTTSSEGARKAKARLSSLRGDGDVCYGKSQAVGLVCGAPVTLEGAREPFLNGDFVVTELRSRGRTGEETCENEFVAIPKGAPFAPRRHTAKPKIRGIQTAVVTGPSNEPQAVHVDRYGRIKVRFFWDCSGKQDDTSSAWLRVSQLGLGGSMVLPRVGWKVSVAFLDGDPDRPIVLGRTYNAENRPPYALPAASADGSFKSMSTPGGAGYNEIKMSDTAGKQGFNISAKKNLNVVTGNDKTESIAVDEDHSVGGNYNVSIGSNETTVVGANQSVDVGNALEVKVTGVQSVSVGASESVSAKADFVENVGGARSYSVGGNYITISCGVRQQIKGAFSRSVGAVQANVSLASIDDNMVSTFDEKVSAVTVQLVAGPSVESVASKDQTFAGAELHAVTALSSSAKEVKQLVGGVHVRNVGGDYIVEASQIVIAGGVGKFSGGGSAVNLDGGPVTIQGSKIAIKAGLIVKQAADLKIG